MTWATLIMGLIGPIALRVLTVLGLGTLTFTGVTVALGGLITMATTNWASLPSDVLALASIAGVPQAIGLVCGAMTSRVGVWAAVSATRFVLGGAA